MKPWTKAKKDREWQIKVKTKALIEKAPSGIKGSGLFATEYIKKGQAICLIDGVLLPYTDEQSAEIKEYAMHFDEQTLIMPENINDTGWHLINHSCNANSDFIEGQCVKARHAISAGKEITAPYHWAKKVPVECLCGEEYCAGNIGIISGKHSEGGGESIVREIIRWNKYGDGTLIKGLEMQHGRERLLQFYEEAYRRLGLLQPWESLKYNTKFPNNFMSIILSPH